MTEELQKQERLQVLAAEINTIKAEASRFMVQMAIAIGQRLTEAKGAVGHGNWEEWLKENVDYSQRKAQQLIQLFKEYGDGQGQLFGKTINPQTLAALSYTQAVALLGIKNPDERAEFVENNDIASMSTRELQEAIKERDAMKEKLKEETAAREKSCAMYEELYGKYNKTVDSTDKAIKEANDRAKQLAKELTELQEKVADGSMDSENNKRIHDLEEELSIAKAEALAMASEVEELKNKPIETAIVEKIPDDVQSELDRLRAAATQPVLDADMQKKRANFAVRFEAVQQDFNSLLDALNELDDADREKFGLALSKLLSSMQEVVK